MGHKRLSAHKENEEKNNYLVDEQAKLLGRQNFWRKESHHLPTAVATDVVRSPEKS